MQAAISAEHAAVDAPTLSKEADVAALVRTSFLRHPVRIAALAAALGAVSLTDYSQLSHGAIAAFVAGVLVVVAVTDLERRIIPNRVIVPAIAIVLVARIAVAPDRSVEWVLAALGAGLFLLMPNFVNGSAMGMGDVKLALFLGAGLGVGVVGALVVAFASIFPFALATVVREGLSARKTTLPFGPFLAFGGLVVLILPPLVGLGGN